MKISTLVGIAAGAICVAISIQNQVYGMQAFGTLAVGSGFYTIYQKEIGYGIRGRDPIGYITGLPAIGIGIALSLVGLFMVTFPERWLTLTARH